MILFNSSVSRSDRISSDYIVSKSVGLEECRIGRVKDWKSVGSIGRV